jgi:DNA-binding NarL/FixJ family response regulator
MQRHCQGRSHTVLPVFFAGNCPYKVVRSSNQPEEGFIPLRILLVDDHELVRKSVKRLLAKDQRWQVCGEAQNGLEAVEKTLVLAPDVVILDLSMPALGGLDVASAIRQAAPGVKIIFFSVMDSPLASRIVEQGDAFVAKDSASADLPLALERLLQQGGSPQSS